MGREFLTTLGKNNSLVYTLETDILITMNYSLRKINVRTLLTLRPFPRYLQDVALRTLNVMYAGPFCLAARPFAPHGV